MAAEIKEGRLIVRAPLWAGDRTIARFVQQHQGWIDKHMEKARRLQEESRNQPRLTGNQLKELAAQAAKTIPERVAFLPP